MPSETQSPHSGAAAPEALRDLLVEMNDLKRVRSAGRQGSIAERLFAQGWGLLTGGGARNLYLVDRINAVSNPAHEVLLSDDLGVPCEAREAMAIAVLGALCQNGVPITLPQFTGATQPSVAGAWAYP